MERMHTRERVLHLFDLSINGAWVARGFVS